MKIVLKDYSKCLLLTMIAVLLAASLIAALRPAEANSGAASQLSQSAPVIATYEAGQTQINPSASRPAKNTPAAKATLATPNKQTMTSSPATTTVITVPLNAQGFSQASFGNPAYPLESTSEGLVLNGAPWTNGRLDSNGYYDGNAAITNQTFNFNGSTTYLKFEVHSPYYLGVYINSESIYYDMVVFYSTNNSWASSLVIPADTWLYLRLSIDDSGNWAKVISTSSYDDNGGNILYRESGSLTPEQQSAITSDHFLVHFRDNYSDTGSSPTSSPTSWLTIGELIYENSSGTSGAALGDCPYTLFGRNSVNLSTGNFIHQETDFDIPSVGPSLSFTTDD